MSITITNAGPTRSTFSSSDPQHSFSGRVLSLALAPDNLRLYAGTYAGVWRSDDGGGNWRQMVRPQPGSTDVEVAGALQAPRILDIAVSPGDGNLVLAAGSGSQFPPSQTRDGIYRSVDGGETWVRVLTVPPPLSVSQIVFAPDDPSLVYAAVGNAMAVSTDAGSTWVRRSVGGFVWHVAVAPAEPSGRRRVYAAGAQPGNPVVERMFVSSDGGTTWQADTGVALVRNVRTVLSNFIVSLGGGGIPPFAGATTDIRTSGAKVLAVEPGNVNRVYLATPGGTTGPSYYDDEQPGATPDGTLCNTQVDRLADEGSLWLGDFTNFDLEQRANWQPLPGPTVCMGGGATPSGVVFVVAKATAGGFLLFFSDETSLHVAAGTPTGAASWHRLDARDVSVGRRAGERSNLFFVHCDPHALVTTGDFEITLKPPAGVSFPYDQNSELDTHVAGTVWMANDGGVYQSGDGGREWDRGAGLDTIDAVNIAGLYGNGDSPALYMGCGDNDNFFSVNGGRTWRDPFSQCGDCDAWFADPAHPGRVLELLPRSERLMLYTSPFLVAYPDAGNPITTRAIPRPPGSNASSGNVLKGFRPVVLTAAGESPLADGDYVFTTTAPDGSTLLLRTRAISSITSDAHWEDPAKAERVGPPLPVDDAGGPAVFVQVAGGHQHPVFYTADGAGNDQGHLWRLDEPAGVWKRLVPGGPPGASAIFARRYFVNPYNPELIYLHDSSGIRVSLDGGESWLLEPSLSQAMNPGGKLSLMSGSLIRDMLFVRDEPLTRFAFGSAGVVCTVNGFEWFTLLNSTAFPGIPESGFFDPVSDPGDRALYVIIEGRSVVRLSPVPAPPPATVPPVFDLLELAAILADA
jgi:photosystem II stability/assembly factor-like uncharacterized protein